MRLRDADQPAQRRLRQVGRPVTRVPQQPGPGSLPDLARLAANQIWQWHPGNRQCTNVHCICMSQNATNAQSSLPRRRRAAAGRALLDTLVAGVLGACNTPGTAGGASTPPGSTGGSGSHGNWYTGGYRYEAGGALPEPATQAEAFRLPPVEDADLVRIARAFGVDGPVREQGGQRSIDDGVRRVCAVGSAWTVSRIGSAGREEPATPGCLPSTATPGNGCAVNPSPVSGTEPTPTGSPTPEERRARALLAKTGLNLQQATAETSRQAQQWTVRLSPRVAGLPVVGGDFVLSGRGASGTVEGHGYLTKALRTGTRPFIGVQAGLKRLNNGLFISGTPVTDTATPGTGGAKVLTVSRAELVLGLAQPDVAHLLPAYRFTLQD